MDIRRKTFVAEARARLGFLPADHGFVGPEVEQHGEYPLLLCVRYHRIDVDVEATLVLSYGGEDHVSADLVYTDQATGIRTRTAIATHAAHTGYQMRRALDRHASELHEFFTARSAPLGQE